VQILAVKCHSRYSVITDTSATFIKGKLCIQIEGAGVESSALKYTLMAKCGSNTM